MSCSDICSFFMFVVKFADFGKRRILTTDCDWLLTAGQLGIACGIAGGMAGIASGIAGGMAGIACGMAGIPGGMAGIAGIRMSLRQAIWG